MSLINACNGPTLACRVITLAPDSDRTQSLLISLRRQAIAAETFAAVDGRSGTPPLRSGEHLSKRLGMIRNGKVLTPTELGCYLSHLRAVKSAFDSGCDFVCMLEDDVILEENFGDVVRELMADDLDLVRLMALKIRRRKVIKTVAGRVQLCRPDRGTLGTQAYLMSRRGMKKFLDHASLIYEAIDHVLDHFYLFDLDTYLIEPHIAYENAGVSSIQKREAKPADTPTVLEKLLHHPVKLYFSVRRHLYFQRHKADLFPNEWPSVWPGKSPRLRGKGKQVEHLADQRSDQVL